MNKIVSLKPIFDNVVIEQLKAQTETDSGFIIPETSQKRPNVAKVLQVGKDCKSGVKEGDFIVIPQNLQVTTDIEVNGNMVAIIKEEHIIAIVDINN